MLVEEMQDFCVALGLKSYSKGFKVFKGREVFLIGGGVIQQNVSR